MFFSLDWLKHVACGYCAVLAYVQATVKWFSVKTMPFSLSMFLVHTQKSKY